METKVCTKCGKNKPLEKYSRRTSAKDGRKSQCKSCVSTHGKKYRAEHKLQIAEYQKEHYAENKQQILERQKQHRVEHRPQILEYQKEYRKSDRGKLAIAKYKKAWMPILKEIYGKIACSKCGYSKCFAALDFHHRQSEVKKFSIAAILKCKVTAERIKEIKKCNILCANCHREHHNGL